MIVWEGKSSENVHKKREKRMKNKVKDAVIQLYNKNPSVYLFFSIIWLACKI